MCARISLSLVLAFALASSACWFCDEPDQEWCCGGDICHPCDEPPPPSDCGSSACCHDGSSCDPDRPDAPSGGRADVPSDGAGSETCYHSYDCPWDEICVDGYCVMPTDEQCRYDSQCDDGFVCNGGECELEADACHTDVDCDVDCVCIDGFCAPEVECTPITGCPDGLVCSEDGECISAPVEEPECRISADCTADEICVEGACEPAIDDMCDIDTEPGDEVVCPDECRDDTGGSSGAGDICEPGRRCGGLVSCIDVCFSERCCYLVCECDESTNTLRCGLRCDG